MLQQTNYSFRAVLKWIKRHPTLYKVQHRGTLKYTNRTKFNILIGYMGWAFPVVLAVWISFNTKNLPIILLAFLAPLGSLMLLAIANLFTYMFSHAYYSREIHRARNKLAHHPATRIAVLGSYGKTTVKELLYSILSSEKNVKATIENKNVLASHASWIKTLDGDEDILIFEYGEARPGDIKKMAKFSEPSIGIITGLAPAHMEDGYTSVEEIAKDFADISAYTKKSTYVNGHSKTLKDAIPDHKPYTTSEVDGWKISNIEIDIQGTKFTMTKKNEKLNIVSGLVGEHLIAPLALSAVLALSLGMQPRVIEKALADTKPFEHRMQPYRLQKAWIIDDTYNGNIEGMRAGLTLLSQLKAKRKIYVTPGLVEQGKNTKQIHEQLGLMIASSQPDKVVLMKNSVCDYILLGLNKGNFVGQVIIEDDPLSYYENLELHVSEGDLVLLQNDWPDSYQ